MISVCRSMEAWWMALKMRSASSRGRRFSSASLTTLDKIFSQRSVCRTGRLCAFLYSPICSHTRMRSVKVRIRVRSSWSILSRHASMLESPSATCPVLMTNLLMISMNSLGVSCCCASLNALSGLGWTSTISPSKPRSMPFWAISLTYSRCPPIWLGSQNRGIGLISRFRSMAICHWGALRYFPLSYVEKPRCMAPNLEIPAMLSRSKAPIHRLMSGFTGFFTKTAMSVPFRASAISCTANGLAVVRAPSHKKSSPAFRQASTWRALATSVPTFIPVSRRVFDSQANPSSPTPSKQLGRVRGFQIPARNASTPASRNREAVSITCSLLSALHGPAISNGRSRLENKPHPLQPSVSILKSIK